MARMSAPGSSRDGTPRAPERPSSARPAHGKHRSRRGAAGRGAARPEPSISARIDSTPAVIVRPRPAAGVPPPTTVTTTRADGRRRPRARGRPHGVAGAPDRARPASRPPSGYPADLAPWPPEPFPGPTEQPPMRPAPVRVLTSKVAVPPARCARTPWWCGRARPSRGRHRPSRTAVPRGAAPACAGTIARCADRRRAGYGQRTGRRTLGPRGTRVRARAVGGAGAWAALVRRCGGRGRPRRRRADRLPGHPGRCRPSTTSTVTSVGQPLVPAATAAPATTPATAPPSSTDHRPGPNSLGVVVGTPADPARRGPRSALPRTSATTRARRRRRRRRRCTRCGGS